MQPYRKSVWAGDLRTTSMWTVAQLSNSWWLHLFKTHNTASVPPVMVHAEELIL